MKTNESRAGVGWWRLWSIQGSFHEGRMQSLGWVVAVLGGWRRRGVDRQDLAARLSAEPTDWNTHPYLAGLAIGTRLRLEDDGHPELGLRSAEALARVLGGLGDRFFWVATVPCFVALALVALLALGPWAVLALWAAMAVLTGWVRARSLEEGYRRGQSVVELLEHPRVETLARRARRVGMVLAAIGGGWLLGEALALDVPVTRPLLVGGGGLAWGALVAWKRWSLQWWAVGVVLVVWAISAAQNFGA